jgi:hypothetical protein
MPGMSVRSILSLVVVAVALAACAPGSSPTGTCPCSPCVFAVQLSVFEEGSGIPLPDFDVVVSLNGSEPQRPAECDEDARTDNTCAFGFDPGVYKMVVTDPGHAPREIVVRLADEGAAECCQGACKRAKTADVFLDPL